MSEKPNRVCKYSKCTYGEMGGRKKYFACNDCDKTNSWKAIGCCFEHAVAYQDEVLASRDNKLTIEDKKEIWKADRIDAVEPNDIATINSDIALTQSDKQHPQDEYTIVANESLDSSEVVVEESNEDLSTQSFTEPSVSFRSKKKKYK